MNRYIFRRLHQNYVQTFKEKYPNCPQHLLALKLLRDYLDDNGIRMPKPKWFYSSKDKKTWVYLPAKISRDSNKVPIKHKVVFNKDFKYAYLL